MLDKFGRNIEYLRISVTDRCNLRCKYCMPCDIKFVPMENLLTYEEIVDVVRIVSDLGIRHIRVTGGEPLVRKGVVHLVEKLKKVEGIETVSITTNGVLLKDYASSLKDAGIDSINVSLDTVDKETFEKITGHDCLGLVLNGINEVLKYDIPLKLNCVSSRLDVEGIYSLCDYAFNMKLPLRFIELMPIGFGKNVEGIGNEYVFKLLNERYGKFVPCNERQGNGPAVYFTDEKEGHTVGFINAVNEKFCKYCNRIRMTSLGQIKSCLCYSGGKSIREALRNGNIEEVRNVIISSIYNKPYEHCFETPESITERNEMSCIGG